MKNKKYGTKKDILLVNLVTSLRFIGSFLIIPVFKTLGSIYAALFSGIFMLTDCIDGILARKLKSSTFFGALFDGITDKLFGIIAFLLLMTINPIIYSIPILLEIGILITQNKKFNNNKNIQSNKLGKIKTWFLGITLVSSFTAIQLLDTQSILNYLKYSSLAKVANIKDTFTLLGLELPLIVLQILTLKSYLNDVNETTPQDKIEKTEENVTEIYKNLENIKQEKEELQNELTKLEKLKLLKEVMFDPEYYKENKDKPIRCLTKNIFKK